MSQSLSPRVERGGGVAVAACIRNVKCTGGLPFPALTALTAQKGEEAWQVRSRRDVSLGEPPDLAGPLLHHRRQERPQEIESGCDSCSMRSHLTLFEKLPILWRGDPRLQMGDISSLTQLEMGSAGTSEY